jgi:peptidoglycan hydrolase-like protein with peptidoglycan-binding domain
VRGTLAGPALQPGRTKAQVVDELMAYLEGVVYSGKGAWGNGTVDDMHAEIAEGASAAHVQAVADKILRDFGPIEGWAARSPYLGGTPAPAPAAPTPWLDLRDVRLTPRKFQAWYNAYPFAPALLPIIRPLADNWGPQSDAALRKVQGRYGLEVDGICGPKTKRLLWDLGWRG